MNTAMLMKILNAQETANTERHEMTAITVDAVIHRVIFAHLLFVQIAAANVWAAI